MADRGIIDPTRQGVVSHEPEPETVGQAAPVTLEEAIAIVDGWASGYAPFRLHQVCRVLRQAYADMRESLEHAATDRDRFMDEASDLQRTFDLRWNADMRAIKHWRTAHPDREIVLPDRADMVVWLLRGFGWWKKKYERHRRAHWTLKARALAAIPCTAGLADCHAPYYRHQPCCNLRVALWPGEEFPTDYLPDEGFIHLFEPGRGDAPRVSAGCVKLVEPTPLGWLDAIAEYRDTPLYMGTVPEGILRAGDRPLPGEVA